MGFFLAFMSAFLFAGSNILIRKGMRLSEKDNGMLVTLFVNFVVLGLSLLIFRLTAHNPSSFNLTGFSLFVLAGLLTTLLGRSMFYAGIRRIGSAGAAAIKNSAPIFTLIFALVILNEKVDGWPLVGISFIFLGLFFQGYTLYRGERNSINYLGQLFALCAAIGFGVGQGVRKQALGYFNDPFAGAFISSVVALIGFSVIEVWKRGMGESIINHFTIKNKYYILGGLMTSFAVLSFFLSLWFTHVAYVGAIVAVEPVLTVMLSRLFLTKEETITLEVITSSSIIFLGAGIISFTG